MAIRTPIASMSECPRQVARAARVDAA